jgi:hypothetical protein
MSLVDRFGAAAALSPAPDADFFTSRRSYRVRPPFPFEGSPGLAVYVRRDGARIIVPAPATVFELGADDRLAGIMFEAFAASGAFEMLNPETKTAAPA